MPAGFHKSNVENFRNEGQETCNFAKKFNWNINFDEFENLIQKGEIKQNKSY
jgi:hypothetical protein